MAPADLGNSAWAEQDASNNAASPNGWTTATMLPNQVEPTGRAMMGALKRWYDKINPTYTTGGTTTAYTVTSTVAEAAYYNGQIYVYTFNATCGASPTLNIDALGAVPIRKFSGGAYTACGAGDIKANQVVAMKYTPGSPGNLDIVWMGFSATDFISAAANNVYTGSNDFTGGSALVTTQTAGDSSTKAASTAFAAAMGIPATTILTSGTGATYTVPTGTRRLRIRMVGGGGGGGGTGGTTAPNGSAGGDTSFNAIVAKGGSGGTGNTTGTPTISGGAGGTGGAGTAFRVPGGAGGWGGISGIYRPNAGGSFICPGAPFSIASGPSAGISSAANTGAGGTGSSSSGTCEVASAGGGGEYAEFSITSSIAATYTYTVGASGAGGIGTGTGAATGGAGGSGVIVVEAFT